MKKSLILSTMLFASFGLLAQTAYDRIHAFDAYRVNWALVELDGLFGFINSDGIEIVKPIYDEIWAFDAEKEGWAKVLIGQKYSFINTKGEEVLNTK